MANHRTCVECGQAVPANSPGELCAACLMRAGLRDETLSFHPEGSHREQPSDPTSPSAMPAAPIKQLAAGDEFGGYKIVRRLGRGGMGVVYEADQRETGRRVALKVLARSLDNAEARKRFLREGRLAASINHPMSVSYFPGVRRQEIERLVRRPIPTEEQLREADAVVQPLLDQLASASRHPSQRNAMFGLEIVPGMMAIIWLEFVWFPSLFTALLFRGGLLMRLFNVVAVRRDGKRASALRMFWRALVPAPLAILLAFIGTVRLAGTEFLPEATDAGSWVGLLLVVFLLVISAWHPQRSISDRLAGTYLVPR